MLFDLKRREGKYIGGCPLYGYQKDPADKNHIVPDPEAAEVVRQIFQLSLEGHGRQSIACLLNQQGVPNPTRYKAQRGWTCNPPMKDGFGLWNRVTVGRILTNEMYTGVMIQGRRKKVSYKSKLVIDTPEDQWYRVEGTHEAIIHRAAFDAVQRGLRLRTKPGRSGEPHLLAGLVKCADCGSTMSKCSNGKQSYLRCKLYADSGKNKLCTRHSVRLDQLIELVSDRIRYYVQTYYELDPEDIQPQGDTRRAALERERKSVAAQLGKRSQALKTLYLDKAAGILSQGQFMELNQSFLDEKSRLERRLAQVEEALDKQEDSRQQTGLMEKAQELLRLETIPRELVTGLIDRIEIGEKQPETGQQNVSITWKF